MLIPKTNKLLKTKIKTEPKFPLSLTNIHKPHPGITIIKELTDAQPGEAISWDPPRSLPLFMAMTEPLAGADNFIIHRMWR